MKVKLLACVILALFLAGCATSKGEVAASEADKLNMRVSELESEVQLKDMEIQRLQEEMKSAQTAEAQKVEPAEEKNVAANWTPKQLQTALKNAGFYNGEIDGSIGKTTRSAIKEFQKANDLHADGIVGKRTWAQLKKHL
ncbi:MAG: hypothetical protein COS99_00225 [Candidatus Omnitrophica bacterium CG07_land_8_20_14_0_80_42_15]|uniref:Peptidoglycan binding-like domain-containing protein n=1 Tax=Candidatus Aquitaenariimonas noxiae TaxID=1974741 RepID=A0A2J0L2V6_9BACT|nr:MAG: hypothetical protein COS99_00225 [Candidatus Omnitrophica bacterium CG07_land_8_20_14_0_80_42_15]